MSYVSQVPLDTQASLMPLAINSCVSQVMICREVIGHTGDCPGEVAGCCCAAGLILIPGGLHTQSLAGQHSMGLGSMVGTVSTVSMLHKVCNSDCSVEAIPL